MMRWSHQFAVWLFFFMVLCMTAIIITSSALPTENFLKSHSTQLVKRGGGGGNKLETADMARVIFPDRQKKSSQKRPPGPERRIEIPLQSLPSSPRRATSRTQKVVGAVKKVFGFGPTSLALPTIYSSSEYDTHWIKRGGGNGSPGRTPGHEVVRFPDRQATSQTRPKGLDRRVEMPLHKQNSSPKSSPSPGRTGGHTVIVFPDRPATSQSRPKGPDRRVEMPLHKQNSSPKSSPPPGNKSPSRTQRAVGAVKKLFGGGRH
ncbi:uncharacterized protein FA14DRAFT_182397 [Meira miltonrushii]|uniref:Transmembrane protein n=1 Tax=Meira miltonrushii TaxID=1280837 RepID=A0A316V263_9BASI|nr:uncharacterized protein FA14DRAFT_182397 [Meira miltonrushii]PWN31600.1 hypothetical protein FA14DRAFT_182397 [Meira miltonrushii]